MNTVPQPEVPHHADDREGENIPLRPMLLILGLVIVVGVLSAMWAWGMAGAALPPHPLPPQSVPAQVAGIEQGLIAHAHDAQDLRDQQRQSLTRYERIQGEPGFARIPIDVAKAEWLREQP